MQTQTVYVIRQWPNEGEGEINMILGIYDSELLAQNALKNIMQARRDDLGGKFTTHLDSSGERVYSIEFDMNYSITPFRLNESINMPRLDVLQKRLMISSPRLDRLSPSVTQSLEAVDRKTAAIISARQATLRRTINDSVNKVLNDTNLIKRIYSANNDGLRYQIIETALRDALIEASFDNRLDVFTEYSNHYLKLKILEIMLKADPTYGTQRGGAYRVQEVLRQITYDEDPSHSIA